MVRASNVWLTQLPTAEELFGDIARNSKGIWSLYKIDKNYFLEESDFLNGKKPDKTEPQITLRNN